MVVDRNGCMLKGRCHPVSRRLSAGRHRFRRGDIESEGQLVRPHRRRGVEDDEPGPDLVEEQRHLSQSSQSVQKKVFSSLHQISCCTPAFLCNSE